MNKIKFMKIHNAIHYYHLKYECSLKCIKKHKHHTVHIQCLCNNEHLY